MPSTRRIGIALLTLVAALALAGAPVLAQPRQPNIIMIMGDDIGWFNIGAYNQGIMAGRTPNLDRLAAEGAPTIATALKSMGYATGSSARTTWAI